MRITVDGKPIDDPDKSIPDVQRCTDVALDHAQHRVQVRQPEAGAAAERDRLAARYPLSGCCGDGIRPRTWSSFRLYTNYHSFIKRAEVRVFDEDQSVRDTPTCRHPDEWRRHGAMAAEFRILLAARDAQLKYLVRVYDADGALRRDHGPAAVGG